MKNGRTSRHEGANIRFSQFYESSLKKKKYLHLRKFLAFLNCVDKSWSPESVFFFCKDTDVIKKDTKIQAETSSPDIYG